jgi:hypothetical protein
MGEWAREFMHNLSADPRGSAKMADVEPKKQDQLSPQLLRIKFFYAQFVPLCYAGVLKSENLFSSLKTHSSWRVVQVKR